MVYRFLNHMLQYILPAYVLSVLAGSILVVALFYALGLFEGANFLTLYVFVVVGAGVLSFAPALIVMLFSEYFHWRHVSVYLTVGVLISILVWLPFYLDPNIRIGLNIFYTILTGGLSGLIYWKLAGCRAGAWREEREIYTKLH